MTVPQWRNLSVTRRVPPMEEFISNTTGATSGGAYQKHDDCPQWRSLSVTRRVPPVEELISNTADATSGGVYQ